MPDTKISDLPAATALLDADLAPMVQTGTAGLETRKATLAQLRSGILTERGLHVRDFGAVGDGTTNDAPAIQAAINAVVAQGGGTVFFGPKRYRIASAITIGTAAVRLQGAGFNEGWNTADGTWLVIDTTGFVPFTFTGQAARGAAVRDIAVRQNHGATQDASWAPTAYDYVFKLVDCYGGVDFDNVFLHGVNKGIYCSNSGRLDIRRLRGQVFTCGVEIDQAYDSVRLHNVHFWPFWSASTYVVRWQQQNGDALLFRRCDGAFIDQLFALGYRSMLRFGSSAYGVSTKFYIGQAYADFTKYGVWVEGSGTEGQIANLTTQGESFGASGTPVAGSYGLHVSGSNSRLQIANLRIDRAEDNAVRVEQSGNRLDVFSLRCNYCNTRNNGAPAIFLANVASGTPNALYLGSLPLLENNNGGPLANGGSNAILASSAPGGTTANPGVMVGTTDTGLYAPINGVFAATAGGVEILRANAGGGITLGAAPGSHALEIITPTNTINQLLVTGAVTGGAVSAMAQGVDVNIPLALSAKGSGALQLKSAAGSLEQARITHTTGAVNRMEITGSATTKPVRLGAEGSDADIGLAIAPKGSGAILTAIPDNAATGGNARGTAAVDLQLSRSAANQVASGSYAALVGGTGNIASGQGASVLGGSGNTASGSYARAGGASSVASGYASVAEGQDCAASGIYSAARGWRANDRGLTAREAFASGYIATQGDAQLGRFVLRGQSTGATAQRLTADGAAAGSANTLNLPNNGTYFVKLLALARQVGGTAGSAGDSASWELAALVRRGASAATTTLVAGGGAAVAPGLNDTAAAAWRLAIAADTTNGGIAISGTGEASKTINWVIQVQSTEAVG